MKTFWPADRLKARAEGASVFARNNLWMINTARVEVSDPKNLYALLVWDEKPTGDGPGGTADCVARVRSSAGGPPSSIQQRCSVVPTGLRVHGLTTRLVRE